MSKIRNMTITDNDLKRCPFCHGTKFEIIEDGTVLKCHCGAVIKSNFKVKDASKEIIDAKAVQELIKADFHKQIEALTKEFNDKIDSLKNERDDIKKQLSTEKGKYTKLKNELTAIKETLSKLQMPKSET